MIRAVVVNRSTSKEGSEIDPSANYFEILGLPVKYAIDRDVLEAQYLERAQRVHPDRFAQGDAAVQRAAMERSAAVNESYRVLRDPVRRAEYLVKLAGIDLDSSDPDEGAPAMDQRFLIEMIERRDQIETARMKGEAAVEAERQRVEDEIEEVFERTLVKLEERDVMAAARLLVEHRYLRRLMDELDEIYPHRAPS